MAVPYTNISAADLEKVLRTQSERATDGYNFLKDVALPQLEAMGFVLHTDDLTCGLVNYGGGSAYLYVRKPEWPAYAAPVKIRVSDHGTGYARMIEEVQINLGTIEQMQLELDFNFRPELMATERVVAAKGSHPVARLADFGDADLELGNSWTSKKGVEMVDFIRYKNQRVKRYA